MTGDDSFFRQIVDHLSEVIWMLDADCEELLYVNPAYQDLVGVTDPTGLHPTQVIHPDNRDQAAKWLEQIRLDIRNGEVDSEYPMESEVSDRAGGRRFFETVGVPVYEDDEVVGVAGISTDVTDRVTRERDLEAQVERLDQFATMVSHDLRSPVTSVLASLELYEATGGEDHLAAARESLSRIDTITADLLQLVRGGADGIELAAISLRTAAEEAWSETDTADATLVVETELTVEAADGHLRTLLANLFRNSVTHGGESVTVTVGALPTGFYVADDGRGIDEELRTHAFEMGESAKGTGIGLAIVDRVATAHDWTVELTESEAGGARFEFTGVSTKPS